MADDGRLAFDIELVASDFEKQAERVKEKLRSIGDSAVQESKRIDNVFADLGTNTDLSTLEKRFNALRTVISENGLAIKQNTELIEELSEKAKDALAKEDYKTFRSLREDITKAQERITDISAETAEYKHILEELETAAGKFKASLPTEPAPLFYASEEDYNHVKKISEEIEELRSKLSETTTDDEFVAINDQIIDLQDELDKCNNKAAEAASALGNNLGNSAAEASTKLYELNDAVKQQEDIYNGLVDELDKVTEKLNEATQAGDTDKVKELQLEYQELSSQVQDASNSLESLKGQQKDASDEWSRMSASINESNGSLVNLLGGQEKYNTIISNLPGPLKGAVNGLSGMVKAAKAFIATPLGAIITVIVGALTAMKTALTGSVDGQKKLAHATGYLQGVLGQLKEVVLKLGQALINMFTNPKEAITNLWQHIKNVLLSGFNVIKEATIEYANIWKSIVTFDWKGVKEHANNFKTIFTDIFEKGKDAVSEYIKKLNEAGKEMGEIAEARKNLEIEESKWQTRKTELEGQESEAMMRMRDTSLSVEEREKALKEYENIINTISGKELSFINQKIALQKREMALTTNNIEKENELRSLETERAQVLANRQRQMTSLQRQRNSLLKAEKAEDSEAIKELRERQQKEIDIMEDGLKKQLAIIDLNYQKELDAIKKREDELKEKNNGTLTAEQQANMDKYRALALQKKEKDDAEARLKWQKSEIETEKETINLRLAEVRKGSEEELRLRLALIEKERQAALIENKLRPEGQRQNESDINAEFDNQRLALLAVNYESYQQQLTDITETYTAKREELTRQLESADPQKREGLKRALKELETTYKTNLKNLQQAFIKFNLGDVFNEQTYQNVKEAMERLREMEAMTDEQLITELGLDGTDPEVRAKIDEFREQLKKVKKEIQDMGKGGYGLKDAFKDAFGGETREDIEQGVDYLINGFQKVGSIVSGLASAMRDFADATNDAHLEKMADTFQSIADTIGTAGGYAAAGAQIGGGIGAIIGAVLGIGQGVVTGILNADAKRLEEEKARREEANNYLDEVIDGIATVCGAIGSLEDTVAGLNYGSYRESLLDAINSLKSVTYDADKKWHDLKESGAYGNPGYNKPMAEALLEMYDLPTLIGKGLSVFLPEYLYNADLGRYVQDEYAERFNNILANWEQATEEEREWARDLFRQFGHVYGENYASIANGKDFELNQKRLELLREMTDLYEKGNISSEKYFAIMMKTDQLQLEMLKQQRAELIGRGKDTTEIDNQIAKLTYDLSERFKAMFEGLAGIDMQSLANKWLDIFKEFGDNMTTVFDKINESIDDMIRNIIYQTFFVQPLMNKLNDVMLRFQQRLAEEQGIDTSQAGWQSMLSYEGVDFTRVAGDMRDAAGDAADAWKTVQEQLSAAGLSMGSSSDRSASAKGIATASQESIDELNGRMTAVQGHTFTISENSNILRNNTNAILSSVRQIEVYTQHLVRMDNDMHNMKEAMETIQLQGVQIRQ